MSAYHAIEVEKLPVQGTVLGRNLVIVPPQPQRSRAPVIGVAIAGVLTTIAIATYLIVRHNASSSTVNCVTSFTTVLGEANGQVAYSNCQSNYESVELNAITVAGNSIPTGNRWTSEEYVTRYTAGTANVFLGAAANAASMWALDQANLIGGSIATPIPLSTFGNGLVFAEGSAAMPRVGDIIVYAQQGAMNLPNGHVAVVVGHGSGEVHVAEQNWSNQMWQNQGYSRAISYNILSNNQGGTAYQLSDYSESQQGYYTILGWKRVNLP